MARFSILYAMGCLALYLRSSTAVCLEKKPTPNYDKLLDKCEAKGRQAGNIGFRAACLELTSKCPVPMTQAKIASEVLTADELFDGVVARTCTRLFVLSCKKKGTAKALDTDPECALLLRKGPTTPVNKCKNAKDAQVIFDKSLDDICSEEEEVTRRGELEKLRDEAEEEDPCECAKDGVSDCVETGFEDCRRHLKEFGDDDKFCYVEGGPACEDAEASESFPGAFWRLC